jgi:hypothetical protein
VPIPVLVLFTTLAIFSLLNRKNKD